MSDPIKPGDMVMLVCACCPRGWRQVGVKGTVYHIEHNRKVLHEHCGFRTTTDMAHVKLETGIDGYIPVPWLVRLDPPAPEVKTETRETTEA